MYWFHNRESNAPALWRQPPFAETIKLNGVNAMRKLAITMAAWLLVGGCLATPLQAADNKSTPPALKVGDVAPDFKLQYFDGTDLKDVTLSQYRGKKHVVLTFYIFALTGG